MSFFRLMLIIIMLQSAAFGAVLIHEMAPSCTGPSGSVSTAEFVELYNTGEEPVDLTGWTLAYRGRTSSSDSGIFTLSGTIQPHSHFLIVSPGYNALIDQPINGNSLGILFPIGDLTDTGPAVVGRLSAAAAQVGLKNPSGTLIDAASYGIEPTYTGVYVETAPKIVGTSWSARRSVSRDNTTHADTQNNSIDLIYPASDDMPGAMSPTNSQTVQAPPKAWNPDPVNNAVNVSTTKIISWNAGSDTISHDVYLGTTNPPAFRQNQTADTYDPCSLLPGTRYYWRIDEVKATETVTGDVWQFDTVAAQAAAYVYLTWKNDPTNSVVVNWYNPNTPGDSNVQYGLTSGYGMSVYNPAVTQFHHVELASLAPGETYHYKVKSSDGFDNNDATFTVPLRNRTSFKFAAFGDNRGIDQPGDSTQYINRHTMLCNWMAARDFDFILQMGDMVNRGNNVEDWTNFYKAEQNLSKSKVIMPSMGNHEIQGSGSEPYIYPDLYTAGLPVNGTAGNDGKVYSFNYGNAHFVCLASYRVSFATQAPWLEADLAAANADPNIVWKFVFMHDPLYTAGVSHTGNKDELAAWGQIFDEQGVDMVFAAHNHFYERTYPIRDNNIVPPGNGNGIYYVTSGGGGAPYGTHDPLAADAQFLATWRDNETHAVCITINGNELTLETITNVNNQVIDTLQLIKGPDYDPADFNKDGWVDAKDLAELTLDWLNDGIWP